MVDYLGFIFFFFLPSLLGNELIDMKYYKLFFYVFQNINISKAQNCVERCMSNSKNRAYLKDIF